MRLGFLKGVSIVLLLPMLLGAADPPRLTSRQMPMARKACYLKAVPGWDSGITHDMMQANYTYADCLENLVLNTLKNYYPDKIDGQDPKKFLDSLLAQVETLGYTVQTELDECAPSCGTMWQTVASGSRARFLEDLLQSMAERILQETSDSGLMEDPRWKQCWDEPEKCNLR